jgi:hypothetical protein
MRTLTDSEARYIEGYAAALQDTLRNLTGESGCAKSYDPMTVNGSGEIMHSYAFNMKDGGRHHNVADYANIEEIKRVLLTEACADIRDAQLKEKS